MCVKGVYMYSPEHSSFGAIHLLFGGRLSISLDPDLTVGRLADQQTSGMHLSQPSHLWDYNTTYNCLYSFCVYKFPSSLHGEHLSNQEIFFFSSLFPFKRITWKYVSQKKKTSYKHIWLHYFSSFYSGNFDCTPVIYFDFSSHWSMHDFRWKFRLTCFIVHSNLNVLYLSLLPIVRSSTLTLKLRFSLLLLWFCL